eukprot:GHVN01058492.1.p1 GENE.GHVN01058492.1~~GHVN01058492.1.p1  ORF type:complete len:793 (+),score=146.50 GHVN01058492.1:1038-3416(+)
MKPFRLAIKLKISNRISNIAQGLRSLTSAPLQFNTTASYEAHRHRYDTISNRSECGTGESNQSGTGSGTTSSYFNLAVGVTSLGAIVGLYSFLKELESNAETESIVGRTTSLLPTTKRDSPQSDSATHTRYSSFKNFRQCIDSTSLTLTSRIGALASFIRLDSPTRQPAQCCGIVGYVGHQSAEPFLREGIQILQNRGYDSCGVATIDEHNSLHVTKYASKGTTCDSIEALCSASPTRHKNHSVGIGHTRWATHGGKTDLNAHPHCDWKHRVSLCHNGTIENFRELKAMLLEKGVKFLSETDTEVITNLIGMYLDDGFQFEEAFALAIGSLRGTWGIACVHKDHPDKIMLARNGSPLLIGAGEKEVFIASEASALSRHTNQFMALKDGEIAVVSSDGIDNLTHSDRLWLPVEKEQVELSPAPFEHWTKKEIYEQPQSLARALNYGGRIASLTNRVVLGGLDEAEESVTRITNLIISGCGTSMYAGMYGELLMQWLRAFNTVKCIDASEVSDGSFPSEEGGIVLLSQSGETRDTIRACQMADSAGMVKLSVVNVVGSQLARMTGCGVFLNAGREVGVASTKAFSAQVAVMCLISAWFAQQRDLHGDRCDEVLDAIHRLPTYFGMTIPALNPICESLAYRLADDMKENQHNSLFVLGKGFAHPVAMEGALKIKEMSYTHAEGFPGGALKHGPFSLIDEGKHTPVVMIILSDAEAPFMLNAAQQVKARGAKLIVITDSPTLCRELTDDLIQIPNNGPLTALLAVVPLQLLAYHLALARGINPDKPRGLAKTVTVS